jgi:hypothetical protein
MANDFRKSQVAVKAEADALAPLFNSGYLYIYDTTMVDGTSNALTTQSQIVRLQLNTTAFTTGAVGYPVTLTANAITGANSTFSSTATWFRCTGNTTTNNLCQGTVGTAGCDLNLNSVVISSGAAVSVSSFVISIPTSS